MSEESKCESATAGACSTPVGAPATPEPQLAMSSCIRQLLAEKQELEEKTGLDLQITHRLLAKGKQQCKYGICCLLPLFRLYISVITGAPDSPNHICKLYLHNLFLKSIKILFSFSCTPRPLKWNFPVNLMSTFEYDMQKGDTNIADKQRSLNRHSSLADLGHGVVVFLCEYDIFFLGITWILRPSFTPQ
jgi:hypothetical protein